MSGKREIDRNEPGFRVKINHLSGKNILKNSNLDNRNNLENKTTEIMKSENQLEANKHPHPLRFKDYKDRIKEYNKIKERIFKDNIVSKNILATRDRYSKRKKIRASIESTILESNTDLRPYGKVEMFGKEVIGLLDSGSSVTILGKGSLSFLKDVEQEFIPMNAIIRVANNKASDIVGKIRCNIKFRGKEKLLTVLVSPNLSQALYLGTDFFKAFGLAKDLYGENELNEISLPSNSHDLSDIQKQKLSEVIEMFPSFKVKGLGKTTLLSHDIDTGDAKPICQRHWPYSPAMQKIINDEIDRMLSLDVIEESISPWSSPLVLVQKPGKNRVCLDARKVNGVTKKMAYPLPHVDGLLSRLADTRFISSVDLKDAFWQIPLDMNSREKTAFVVPGRGLYQFKVMPFGLCNAAQRLCQLMDQVIPHQYRDKIFVYLDDLLVVSSDFDEHLRLLKLVAEKLSEAKLTINVEKSKFCLRETKYLGYRIGDGVLKPDNEKILAITQFPIPNTIKKVRSFLGMCGWYRRFLKDFASVAAPLTDCLKSPSKFKLTEEAIQSFENLKGLLTTAPLLVHADFSKPFIINCDASTSGIGGVLSQLDENNIERPIYYYSQKLSPRQKVYSITELECLAAVASVKKFRAFVEGQPFKIVTDHASLKWLMQQRDLSGKLARWSLKLQAFDFEIEHRRGVDNVVPDALSRAFVESIDPGIPIDLESEEFHSTEYEELKKTIEDNSNQLPDLKLQDGLVYKRTRFSIRDEEENGCAWKLWLPRGLTQQAIKNAHDSPETCHGGSAKTMKRLQEWYYWPNMPTEVKEYVRQCEVCATSNVPNKQMRPTMGQPIEVCRSFQNLYIDFLGEYPSTKNGNRYIFICIDQLTKFVFLKPMKKSTAYNVCKFFEEELMSTFGVPEMVFSDNARQFLSKEFQKMMSDYGIRHLKPPYYHAQANASERMNREVIKSIRVFAHENHATWDVMLHKISMALRSGYHQSIGTSPYYAAFGQNMILHGSSYELLRKLQALSGTDVQILPNDVKINRLHERIQENLQKAHDQNEKQYNLRATTKSYDQGQEVYRRNFVLSDKSNKICKKFCKKFVKVRIRKVLGANRYETEDLSGKYDGIYHGKDIMVR